MIPFSGMRGSAVLVNRSMNLQGRMSERKGEISHEHESRQRSHEDSAEERPA